MSLARHLLYWSLAAPVTALAQNAGPFDGPWRAKFASATGLPFEADVVLQGAKGSWMTIAVRPLRTGKAPCVGPTFPLTVEAQSAAQLTLAVDAEATLQGCKRWKVTARPVDSKTLVGSFPDGRSIRLERK